MNVPGIYYIKISDKDYVGSSTSIGHRLKNHIWAMNNCRHHNRTMQNCWDKYKTATFKILEECHLDVLIDRESFYIKQINPYMNHILDPQKIVRDETYKKRLSEGLKKAYAEGLEIHNKQKVHMYNTKGKYLKTFDSITEAAESFNTDPSGICAALNGRAYSAQKHLWSTSKLDKLNIPKKNYKVKAVIQLTINGKVINKWNSVRVAERELNITNISRAASKNRTTGGFKWKFE